MPAHSIAQILRYHIADIKIAQIYRYHKTGRPQTEVLPVSFSVISDSLLSQILFCCVFTAATDSLLLRDPLLLRNPLLFQIVRFFRFPVTADVFSGYAPAEYCQHNSTYALIPGGYWHCACKAVLS